MSILRIFYRGIARMKGIGIPAALIFMLAAPVAAGADSGGASDSGGLPSNRDAGFAAVTLFIPQFMDCRAGGCRTVWGECFEQTRDRDGIVNLDTMTPVDCRRAGLR